MEPGRSCDASAGSGYTLSEGVRAETPGEEAKRRSGGGERLQGGRAMSGRRGEDGPAEEEAPGKDGEVQEAEEDGKYEEELDPRIQARFFTCLQVVFRM